MHFVAFYFFAFHRFESAGSNVKGDFFQIHSFFLESVQYAFCEMQTGCRGGYGPFYLRVDGLVSFLVAFLCLSVQVGRNGQLTEEFQNVGKGYFRIVPGEINPMAGAVTFSTGGSQCQGFAFDCHFLVQRAFFPFLQVANHAEPGRMLGLLEVEYIVIGLDGFQTENLN